MALYLIDFENVHDSGLTGVLSLTENDEIFIFYSSKSEHMSFDTHVNIMKTAARVKYIKLRRSAKNYLDFQLCTHLGFLIGSKVEGPYYIISKDTGYESVIDYWNDHGITVIRQPCVVFNHPQTRSSGQRSGSTPPALVTVQENSQISADGPLPEVLPLIAIDPELYPAKMQNSKDTPSAGQASESPISSGDDVSSCSGPFSDPEGSGANDIMEEPADKAGEAEAAIIKGAESVASGKGTVSAASGKGTVSAASGKGAESVASGKGAESAAARGAESAAIVKETGVSVQSGGSESDTSQEDFVIKPQTLSESYRKRVRTALKGKGIPSANYSSIYKAIINSYDKLALNNLMVKTFGSSKGGVVYNLIKDIFMDYHSGK